MARHDRYRVEALESRVLFNAPGAGFTLTFDDEFNGTSLDTGKWSNYLPWANDATKDNRWEGGSYLDYMVNGNTTVNGTALAGNLSESGGELHLSTHEVPTFRVGSQTFNYTGAMITTGAGSAYRTFSSGYFEIRARVPQGAGNWPAFWMTNGWPPEDDILEYKPSGGPWNHQGLYGMDGAWHDNTTTGASVPSPNWHTYAMEWAPGSQKFFIDGRLTYSVASSTAVPGSANPEYLLLNSGVYSGQQGGYSNGNDNTLDVDYVRVYGYTGATTPAIANPGFDTTGGYTFTNSNAFLVTGPNIGRTGTGDLHIEGAGEADQTITGLAPDTTYTLTGYAEVGEGTATGLLGVKGYGGTDTSAAIGTSGAWSPGAVTFTTGPGSTSAVIYCANPGAGKVYFDDLALIRPTVLTPIADATDTPGTAEAIPVGVSTGSAGSNWSFTASSSDPALVAATGLVGSGTGGSGRALTVTPEPGQTGAATITVTATDALGATSTQAFQFAVAPVAPVASPPTPTAAGLVVSQVTAAVPASVVGGSKKARGTVSVLITNSAPTRYAGAVSIAVSASTDATVHPGVDLSLGRLIKALKLKAGARKILKVRVKIPAPPQAGAYVVLAAVSTGGDVSVGHSDGTIQIDA